MATKMDEEDWAHTLAVFRACPSATWKKAKDDRRFLEALHFFTVENVRWALCRSVSVPGQHREALRPFEHRPASSRPSSIRSRR
jgi:hypothetical protein